MLLGARCVYRKIGEASDLYDDFTGTTVNPSLWTVEKFYYTTVNPDTPRIDIIDDKLHLRAVNPEGIGGSTHSCGSRLTSTAAIATTGLASISFYWAPLGKYYNNNGMGYVAVMPATESRMDTQLGYRTI
jgi:hypothetical protein